MKSISDSKFQLEDDARAYKLGHDVLYLCCDRNEYIFNDKSSRFIVELISNECTIEETQSINDFKFKMQGYVLKDWLLKKKVIKPLEEIKPELVSQKFYDLSCDDGVNPLNVWDKSHSISDDKSIDIRFTQYHSSHLSSLECIKKTVLQSFVNKFREECPLFLESQFSRLVIDIYENQSQFSVSSQPCLENSLYVPIVFNHDYLEIGPITDGSNNIGVHSYKQRILIRAGATHMLEKNIPFQVPSELPEMELVWNNIIDILIYIFEYKIESLADSLTFNNKVWSVSASSLMLEKQRDDIIKVNEDLIYIASAPNQPELFSIEDVLSIPCFTLYPTDRIQKFSNIFALPSIDLLHRTRLQNRFEGNDGGHRLLSAADTRKNIIRLVNPVTGIIQKMVYTGLSNNIFKYSARKVFGASNKAQMQTMNSARASGYPVSSDGKGRSAYQAQVSCIAEAIERYSANFPILELPTIAKTYDELGELALHPNEIMLFSKQQFANRLKINSEANGSMHVVPEKFKNDQSELWTPIINLNNVSQSKLIPTSMLGYNYIQAHQLGTVISCSNGLSSGNTVTESIIQAIYEIIERDSCAMWWYNRLSLGELEIPESLQEYCEKLILELKQLQRSFQLVHLPTDFNVSVVGAISHRFDGTSICVGLGCHHDHTVAVSRAVTEMYQMLLGEKHYMKSLSLSDGNGGVEKVVKEWLMTANISEHPYLVGIKRDIVLPKSQSFTYLEQELEWLLGQFNSRNFEVYALNFTSKTVGFPVSKVFIPGMRHFWPRFAPGRLYELPVTLGYINTPTPENNLNPIGFFF